jgi:hypothetical protein
VIRHANGSAATNGSHGGWESSNAVVQQQQQMRISATRTAPQAISVAGAKEGQKTQEVSTDEGNAKF